MATTSNSGGTSSEEHSKELEVIAKLITKMDPVELQYFSNRSPENDGGIVSLSLAGSIDVALRSQLDRTCFWVCVRESLELHSSQTILSELEAVVNGKRVRVVSTRRPNIQCNQYYLVSDCNPVQLALSLFDYFQRVFKCEKVDIDIDPRDMSGVKQNLEEEMKKHYSDEEVLSVIKWSKRMNVENFGLAFFEISPDVISCLFEGPQEIQKLTLLVENDLGNVSIPECAIQVKTAYIEMQNRMPMDLLRAAKLDTIHLRGSEVLTNPDFSVLMNAWLAGELPQFKCICYDIYGNSRLDANVAVEEFRSRGKEWDKSERGQFYPRKPHRIDCKDGVDFRNKDGALGTIVCAPKVFAFVVWHEPFPDAEKCSLCNQYCQMRDSGFYNPLSIPCNEVPSN